MLHCRMTLRLRPFTSKDYGAFATLWNRVRPESPLDLARLRRQESLAEGVRARWLAYAGEQIVGSLSLQQMDVVHAFQADILLLPLYHAAMEQLYAFVLEQYTPHRPCTVVVHVRENWLEQVNFYHAQGFSEHERMWKFYLNPQELDFSALPYTVPAEVRLLSLHDWLEHTPEHSVQFAFYDAVTEIRQSVPSADPVLPESFALWLEKRWAATNLWKEGTQVALVGNSMVGLSKLHTTPWRNCCKTGLTGVRAAWRRQGIARALKIRGLQRAKQQGMLQVFTLNHALNLPMLELNASLGFIREVGWISLRKMYSGKERAS